MRRNRRYKYPITIYALYDPRTDTPFYVGHTWRRLSDRLSNHINDGIGRDKAKHISEIMDAGLRPVIRPLEVIEAGNPKDHETKWIVYLQSQGFTLANSWRTDVMKAIQQKP